MRLQVRGGIAGAYMRVMLQACFPFIVRAIYNGSRKVRWLIPLDAKTYTVPKQDTYIYYAEMFGKMQLQA